MVALWILFGLIVLIGLPLAVPLRIFLNYDEELHFRIKYGPISIYNSDQPKKAKLHQAKKPSAPKRKKRSVIGPLLDFLGLSEISSITNIRHSVRTSGIVGTLQSVSIGIKRLFSRTSRLACKGRFKKFRLSIVVGDTDCGDAAMLYGQVCAIVFPLVSYLGKVLRFSEQKVDIRCDYTLEQTDVQFEGQLNYLSWHLVRFAMGLTWDYLKNSLKKGENV